MTPTELITMIRDILGDPDDVANTWTVAQILTAINQACLHFARKTGATYVEEVMTSDYNGVIDLDDTVVEVIRVMREEAP